MSVDLGRVAFQAFRDSRMEQTRQDPPMLEWEELSQATCIAWRHAAIAVLQQVDKEREMNEQGLVG